MRPIFVMKHSQMSPIVRSATVLIMFFRTATPNRLHTNTMDNHMIQSDVIWGRAHGLIPLQQSFYSRKFYGWTVGRAPSSLPFDFYSTIDLRCGLIYRTLKDTRLSTVTKILAKARITEVLKPNDDQISSKN
jgi:hypothetical protein